MPRLAERLKQRMGCGDEDRSDAGRLPETAVRSRFVIISVAIDREACRCWGKDHEIVLKYGIIHYAGERRAGRFLPCSTGTLHPLMPVFRSIEELCLNALVLNFPLTHDADSVLQRQWYIPNLRWSESVIRLILAI